MSSEKRPPVLGRCSVCGRAPVAYTEMIEAPAFERVLIVGEAGPLTLREVGSFEELEVIRGDRICIASSSRI